MSACNREGVMDPPGDLRRGIVVARPPNREIEAPIDARSHLRDVVAIDMDRDDLVVISVADTMDVLFGRDKAADRTRRIEVRLALDEPLIGPIGMQRVARLLLPSDQHPDHAPAAVVMDRCGLAWLPDERHHGIAASRMDVDHVLLVPIGATGAEAFLEELRREEEPCEMLLGR